MQPNKEKYDRIGRSYNSTRRADPYLAGRLFHHLAPEQDKEYLDIGCGTGNYTLALHQMGVPFIAADPSEEMLKKARIRNQSIQWLQGKAESLPLDSGSVDGIMASLTLHHWSSLEKGFVELFRVAKPEAKLVIFTSTPEQMEGYWLNHYFPRMLKDSIVQMPSYEVVADNLQKAGFKDLETEKYFVKRDLQDLFLYAGKERPELYLDPQVRQGISSFSDLSRKEEVESGLRQLQEDIQSGKIRDVMEAYENDRGDYLFVVGRK